MVPGPKKAQLTSDTRPAQAGPVETGTIPGPAHDTSRTTSDRRTRHIFPLFHFHGLRGRRRSVRRTHEAESHDFHLDWYHPKLMVVMLGVLLLCIADAHNTLQLLANGAKELNIFMDILINKDIGLFFFVKLGITTIGLVLMVIYHNLKLFRLMKIRHILYSVLAMYAFLVGYQLAIWPGAKMPLPFILSI